MLDSSILLPNYNNEFVLPHTFAHLRKQIDCSRVKLVAVDDGSEDDGLRVLKEEAQRSGFGAVEIIELEHEGIVSALNAGMQAIDTEFTFRIDGDALVMTPDWVERMKRFLKHPDIGIVGGHTIFDSGLVHGFGRSIMSEHGLHDRGTYPVEPLGGRTFDFNVWRPFARFPEGLPYESDAVLATCIAYRTEDAKAFGCYDPRFNPVWIEDDDFGLAMRKSGKKVVIDPAIHILHKVSLRGSRTPKKEQTQQVRQIFKTKPWIRMKNDFQRYLTHALFPRKVNFSPMKGKMFYNQVTTDWRSTVLTSHYANWEEKWGFHPLNPNFESLLAQYYETELCWRYNHTRYENGRKAIASIA